MINMDELDKEILKSIYVKTVTSGRCQRIDDKYPLSILPKHLLEDRIKKLEKESYISVDNNGFQLTDKGRRILKIGVLGGAFDIIHIGHIQTIKEAKKHVDVLAIVIARDKTVYNNKGRYPINNEVMRMKIIQELKDVDIAVLGDEKDFMKPINILKPDIIFLGYDQSLPHSIKNKIPQEITIKQLDEEVKGIKTTYIIRRLREIFQV